MEMSICLFDRTGTDGRVSASVATTAWRPTCPLSALDADISRGANLRQFRSCGRRDMENDQQTDKQIEIANIIGAFVVD